MPANLMIYGATGYTGKLLARQAKDRGLAPVLSGRDPEKLRAVAEPLGFEHRAVSLSDADGLRAALAEVDVVLHSAGPFSATSEPMVDACLETATHYLDITGEIDVFEACASRDAEARERGLVVMPGVGFDVVPSDCLAAHVHRRLSDATSLLIAIQGLGGMSRGTAKTGAEAIGQRTRVRRGGCIVEAPEPIVEDVDYGDGPHKSIAVSWGDVSTAYYSTGIPDVTVCFAATRQLEKLTGMGPWTRWLMGTALVQAVIKRMIDRQPPGPSEEQRRKGSSTLVAIAENAAGERSASRLRTQEGYTLTALTGIDVAVRVLAGEVEPGFHTPSTAFGPDFVLGFEGCEREDL
ncbi:MAG: saccharopine dehydrogenase NADP-binding domain-containing protein [Thermoanaerobaculia bacterium]